MQKLVLGLAALALSASAVFAGPIEDREAIMKERGGLVGGLTKIVKGDADFDAAAVLATLEKLQANARGYDVDALFPAGSDVGKTEASPKIWQDMAGFKAEVAKFNEIVDKAVAAPPQDVAGLKATVAAIGAECSSCHQNWRIKKN
jgi:cytochrome c556